MKALIEKNKRRARRKKHIRKTIKGTPERPRMSVFSSNKHLYVQVIDDTKGVTIASMSNTGKENGTLPNSVEGAAKIGEAVGKKLKEMKIESVAFDRNGFLYHGKIKAIAEGARKAGLKF